MVAFSTVSGLGPNALRCISWKRGCHSTGENDSKVAGQGLYQEAMPGFFRFMKNRFS